MLAKNIQKQEQKNRPLWTAYYERIIKNKKAYSRKTKYKVNY